MGLVGFVYLFFAGVQIAWQYVVSTGSMFLVLVPQSAKWCDWV